MNLQLSYGIYVRTVLEFQKKDFFKYYANSKGGFAIKIVESQPKKDIIIRKNKGDFMHHKQVSKFGFTLAELMAVVVIVSLMVVLSTGYYRRSIEQARRYWMDNFSSMPDKLSKLDIQLSKRTSCGDLCVQTEHFQVEVDDENGVTTAQRKDGKYADLYYIQINPHFASSHRDQIACVGTDAAGNGKAFCESMGYTTCSNADVCTKPL